MINWITKMSRVSPKVFDLGVVGELLIVLSVGAIYSRYIVQYTLYLFLFASIILLFYMSTTLKSHYLKTQIPGYVYIVGFLGLALQFTIVGSQLPQLFFKYYLLIIGIALTLPAMYELFFKKEVN